MLDDGRGTCIGPDECVCKGLAGLRVPYDGCFALVGDSDGGQGGYFVALGEEFLCSGGDTSFDGLDYFGWVVFQPSFEFSIIGSRIVYPGCCWI